MIGDKLVCLGKVFTHFWGDGQRLIFSVYHLHSYECYISMLGGTAKVSRPKEDRLPMLLTNARELGSATNAMTVRERLADVVSIAATHADDVDTRSRFPNEAIAALRAKRLLSIAIPEAHGGEGVKLAEVLNVCYALGRVCSASAMIFAMHQIKIACLVGHAGDLSLIHI